MEESDEVCKNCGQKRYNDITFHLMFCYDVYIVSPPCPQKNKHRSIDDYLTEHIVKPLEQQGYNCYHGCRNMTGGEFIISAISNPIAYIPTTIVPIYKDRDFASLRNFLFRADLLKRIVLLLFDSSKPDPAQLLHNCFSISKDDLHMLPKLIETINVNRNIFPLHKRKALYEMENDPESTISSAASDSLTVCSIHRSDSTRISFFRKVPHNVHPYSESITSSNVSDIVRHTQWRKYNLQDTVTYEFSCGEVFMHDIKDMTSPNELLSHCNHTDQRIRHFAAKILTKIIKKDIITFSDNVNLQSLEGETRVLLDKYYTEDDKMDSNFVKLYCWVLAAIYIRIFQRNTADLKAYVKSLPSTKYKVKWDPSSQVFQRTYHELVASLRGKLKMSWQNRLNDNEDHVKKLEYCLSIVECIAMSKNVEKGSVNNMIRYLITLPWDIRHIFLVIITEKIFEKNLIGSSLLQLLNICTSIGKKHSEIFIDVTERATEHIQENYTKDTVDACLILLANIWDTQKIKKKNTEKLLTGLKRYFLRLVYHPLIDVRIFIVPPLFITNGKRVIISQLGSSCLTVDQNLVEACIREKLSNDYPDMIIDKQVQAAWHSLIFEAQTPDGEALLYVHKQRTLNDILQTDSTDDALENFQSMSRAVKLCQGEDSIVKLRNIPSNGTLPFFVVEHGIPLLHFLHKKENQLQLHQIIEILIDITKAVQHCHAQSVVLRDITPASFVVVLKSNGSFKTKLASFLNAKCKQCEEAENGVLDYVEDVDSLSFQGDRTEPVAAYFSAPETLHSTTFSKYTDIWMLNATLYSILLYGRRPFQELAHLNVSQFVKEIISDHKAEIPNSLPPDLWKILVVNLDFQPSIRMSTENLLEQLNSYKNHPELQKGNLYKVTSICSYINPQDIQRGYLDIHENWIKEKTIHLVPGKLIDDMMELTDCLQERVSVRMNLSTRKRLQALNHQNILQIKEIINGSDSTTLISYPLRSFTSTLDSINPNTDWDTLLNYLEQTTAAVQYLHSQKILHCDLRGSHIYVDEEKGIVKVGRLGRARSHECRQTHPYIFKMMPLDAEKWSSPEVRANGLYSHASDIFALATVFLEAITQNNPIYVNYSISPFSQCSNQMEDYAERENDAQKYKLMKLNECLQKCCHLNPTKRPSLDYIRHTIQQLRRKDSAISSEEIKIETEVEYEEFAYETVLYCHPCDFSLHSAWDSVVYELESSNKFQKITTNYFGLKQASVYENIQIQQKRSKKTMGIIL